MKTISPSVKQFFSQACALKHISMAGTKLPPDAVRYGVGLELGSAGGGWTDLGWMLVLVVALGVFQGCWMGP